MNTIIYYVTAHGYGHGTRSCDILNALRAASPDARIVVKTDLPRAFMASRLAPDITVLPGAFDVGLIQKDAIHVDLEASVNAIERLYAHEEELIVQEASYLKAIKADVVVADLPAIPLAAAQRAGIQNIAVGNFGWDWIYEEFMYDDPRWRPFVEKIEAVYQRTNLLLRLPFAEPMNAFPNQIDLPLLARPGTDRRAEIAANTGADPEKKWALISFYALNLEAAALKNIAALEAYEFFAVEPLEWPGSSVRTISRSHFSFADTLASCDFVVTKPGYGIISECVANDKPIIYSDRANFKEYPVLVEAIGYYCRSAFIPNAELYAGNLKRALDEASRASDPEIQIARGGAEHAAMEILNKMNAVRMA